MRTKQAPWLDITPLPIPRRSTRVGAQAFVRKITRNVARLTHLDQLSRTIKARVRTFRYAHNRGLAVRDGRKMVSAMLRRDWQAVDKWEDRQSVHRQKAKRFEGENR